MNLPVYIIPCSPPSMNLPAHDTASLDPSMTSLLKCNTHKYSLQHYRMAQPQAPPGETSVDCLAKPPHCQAPNLPHTHYFTDTAWQSTPGHQAPRGVGISHAVPIAGHQQAARRHTRSTLLLVLALSLVCPLTRILPKASLTLIYQDIMLNHPVIP